MKPAAPDDKAQPFGLADNASCRLKSADRKRLHAKPAIFGSLDEGGVLAGMAITCCGS
jgi:hypothetical protein